MFLPSKPTDAQVAFLRRLKVDDTLINRMSMRDAMIVIEVLLADKKRRAQEKKNTDSNRKKIMRLAKRLHSLVQ